MNSVNPVDYPSLKACGLMVSLHVINTSFFNIILHGWMGYMENATVFFTFIINAIKFYQWFKIFLPKKNKKK